MPVADQNGGDYGTYRDQVLARGREATERAANAVQHPGRSQGAIIRSAIVSQPPDNNLAQQPLPTYTKLDGVCHLALEDGTPITTEVRAEASWDQTEERWAITILPRHFKTPPGLTAPTPKPDPPTIPRDENGRQYRSRATKPRRRQK